MAIAALTGRRKFTIFVVEIVDELSGKKPKCWSVSNVRGFDARSALNGFRKKTTKPEFMVVVYEQGTAEYKKACRLVSGSGQMPAGLLTYK